MHYHVLVYIEQPQFTNDVGLTQEQCKQASERISLTALEHKRTFEKGKKEIHHGRNGEIIGHYVKECEGYEWITQNYFDSDMQDITLKVRTEKRETIDWIDQLLPWGSDEPG